MVIGHENYSIGKVMNRELYKMSNIWRYSSRLIQKPENLAEHSFYVAFKIYEFGYMYNLPEDIIAKAVKIALCHDCGEIYTGDLPHSLKIYSPSIKALSEELEVKLIKENFPCFSEDFEKFMSEKDTIVSKLVEIGDVIDVIMFIDREETLGNKDEDILQIRNECYERYFKLITEFENLLNEDGDKH